MNLPSQSHDVPVNKNLLLVLIVLTSFINPFMGAAVNIALPSISMDFSMNAVQMGWVSMSFLLASVAILLPIGKLADITGRKKIFILGNLVVSMASVFCALSKDASMLIFFRVIQGLGSALMLGTGMAMITSAFPPQHRGRAIGINVSAVYLGLTMAPLLGGVMTEHLGWRSIFWLNVPFGLIIIPLTVFFIRGEWRDARDESFDLTGSLIYAVAIAILMYGFSKLPQPIAVILTLIGVLGMVFFVIYENKATNPIINLRLFTTNKVFAYSNLAALINYAATFAVTFVLSLFLQYIKGMKPTDAGLLLVTQPVLMTLVASFSGRMSDRMDPRILASAGMGIIVVGLVMLAFVHQLVSSSYIISCLVILGIGFGMFSSPNTNSVMSSVEKRFLGVASATIGTMRLAGQMLSMAIATLVLHVLLGDQKISQHNHPQFLEATKVIFGVFAVLCVFGVYASMKRGKK